MFIRYLGIWHVLVIRICFVFRILLASLDSSKVLRDVPMHFVYTGFRMSLFESEPHGVRNRHRMERSGIGKCLDIISFIEVRYGSH